MSNRYRLTNADLKRRYQEYERLRTDVDQELWNRVLDGTDPRLPNDCYRWSPSVQFIPRPCFVRLIPTAGPLMRHAVFTTRILCPQCHPGEYRSYPISNTDMLYMRRKTVEVRHRCPSMGKRIELRVGQCRMCTHVVWTFAAVNPVSPFAAAMAATNAKSAPPSD